MHKIACLGDPDRIDPPAGKAIIWKAPAELQAASRLATADQAAMQRC